MIRLPVPLDLSVAPRPSTICTLTPEKVSIGFGADARVPPASSASSAEMRALACVRSDCCASDRLVVPALHVPSASGVRIAVSAADGTHSATGESAEAAGGPIKASAPPTARTITRDLMLGHLHVPTGASVPAGASLTG